MRFAAALRKNPFTAQRWLRRYRFGKFKGDALAGLTVGVMLIPMGMAYAVLAGVPPIYGLYAGLVPPLVYAFFGTSRHLSVGPVAIDMLIVAAGVGALAGGDGTRYLALALALGVMVGIGQIAMAVARIGFAVNFLSRPVIVGFTTAAPLIIGFSQLGNLLGIDVPSSQYVHVLLWEAAQQIGAVALPSLAIGGGGIILLMLLKWWKPLFPGALAVVVLGTLATWKLGANVEVVGAVPTGLPAPDVPDVGWSDVRSLLPTAVTLALVQFMGVVSLGKVFAARFRYAINANRELFAIGSANVAGALFQGVPVSGSFSRSAVNVQAGARTPMAGVIAAFLVGLTLLFLTPLFYHLPIPALAAIIMVSAFGLIDVAEVRYLFRAKQRDGYVALFTFAATLLIGIQEGILLGIAASVLALLYRISRPRVAVLGHLPGTHSFRNLQRAKDAVPIGGLLILRIDAGFSFANAGFIRDFILDKSRPAERRVRAVVIDGSTMNDLDTTAAEALQSVAEMLEARGIDLYFTGVKGYIRDVMRKAGLVETVGENHFLMSPHRAVQQLLEEWDAQDGTDRLNHYLDAAGDEEVQAEENTPAATSTPSSPI